LVQEIKDIEKKFTLHKIAFSSQMVIDALKEVKLPITKKDESHTLLFDFIDKYISDHSTTREQGSLSVYKALKNHLSAYQRDKKRKITFLGIDYSFFQDFQNYLISERRLSNTTVAKQLSTVKTFLNYARMKGIAVSDRFKDFKIKRESLEVIALTNDEFETLYKMDLRDNIRLDQVRDVFCFSCATGLRYSDLAQLKWEHIKRDEIRLTVKKTKETLSIPLNPYSAAILKKYKGRHKPLPVISNQKMNQYLNGKDDKESNGKIIKHYPGLCEIAGIDEPIEIVRFRGSKREEIIYPKYELISVHTGRKTFATLSLEKGMSAEEVMTITGHKDYKSFKRYVKITEQRKKVVMSKAWGAVKNTNLKAV
jgi:integrase